MAEVSHAASAAELAREEAVALFKKRSAKSKSNVRKRPATPPPQSDSGSEYSSEDESGQRVKRRKKSGVLTASSNIQKATSDGLETSQIVTERLATIKQGNDATKQSDWYDENAIEMSERSLLGRTRARPAESPTTDRVYKGAAGYQSFIQKNPNAPNRQIGPVKAPTNIRTITVTDFAPDVCKDYKQTGFCGFGDSCKFLHAREDYKQGWELDKDWEIRTKGKKLSGQTVASANRAAKTGNASDDEDEAMLEKIPFACIICKNPYTYPIVTKCGHYFCEACALKRYKKDPTCAACGSGTGGIFNVAKNLRRLLDKKRDRARKRKEKAKQQGEEVSSDEERADGDE